MPRPSIKEKRTEEILSAYEKCIALYGVDGATLNKIAETANMARPLLRHNVGNSEDLLNLAVERFLKRTERHMYDFEAMRIDNNKQLLDLLFHTSYSDMAPNDTMISAALITAAQSNPELKKQMTLWLQSIKNGFDNCLTKLHPNIDHSIIKVVSAGIIGIYFNVDALVPIEQSEDFRTQSYKAAERLLSTL